MAIVVFISTQNKKIEEYPILEECVIGRSRKCDLIIEDSLISGKHGCFKFSKTDQLFYIDLDSTNGSFLNETRVNNVQFKINDVLRVGNTTIVINEKMLTPHEKKMIGDTLTNQEKEPALDSSEANKSEVTKESSKERLLKSNKNESNDKKLGENYSGLSNVELLELEAKDLSQKKKKK